MPKAKSGQGKSYPLPQNKMKGGSKSGAKGSKGTKPLPQNSKAKKSY